MMGTGTWSSEKGGMYVNVRVAIKPRPKKAKKKPAKRAKRGVRK